MQKHKILFYNYGENSSTAMSPKRLAKDGDGDLYESRCVSFDNDMLVKVKVGEVREVELPDDLDPEDYCRAHYHFDTLWVIKGAKDLPLHYQFKLINKLEIGHKRWECAKLLTTDLRSPFRIGLRAQLIEWLEDRSKYAEPFSSGQWAKILQYCRR